MSEGPKAMGVCCLPPATNYQGESPGARHRALRLLGAYYDLTLQLKERFGAEDPIDLVMVVLIAIGDLGDVPMDAELLTEKLGASRSTVERRLRGFLDRGLVVKERQGKAALFRLGPGVIDNPQGRWPGGADITAEMVGTLMNLVRDLVNEE
ncbi:hypothetical protein H2509_14500 [Stappia sp. F7233]|uniref:Uncharacterized protein n=1 Tax=Stappia albiluteola TaxID=2758565 RepID=A0A839AHW8_9HYPH|nr:hypothetical protein [Stappia albiluteola]MBA5778337.1 hypothetical protein [Stappia albiluteola]